MSWDDLPPPPVTPWGGFDPLTGGAWDVVLIDVGAVLAPYPQGSSLTDAAGHVIYAGAEPAPAPPEPIPPLEPQPPPPPQPQPDPINDPEIEPRTPITPRPLPPVGEPTIPPEPELPSDIFPPGRPGVPPAEPIDIPPVAGIGLGEIIVGIGGLLFPTPTAPPEIDSGFGVPPVDIPTPSVSFPPLPPELGAPPVTEPSFPPPEEAPDVIVVTPTLPSPTVAPSPWPLPDLGGLLWPILQPSPRRRTRPQPVTRSAAPPLPSTPPLPTSPPIPVPPPTATFPPPGTIPSTPTIPLPRPPTPSGTLPTPLTPSQTPSVESPPDGQTCETPRETKERRQRNRDSCRKLIRIKVKAHYRKVCVSEFIEHEAKRQRKRLVKKYVTKPAGKLGKAAADWFLREVGLTPYADQAKDIRKRVVDLTKKSKKVRVEIPGTHGTFDPGDLIPKGRP